MPTRPARTFPGTTVPDPGPSPAKFWVPDALPYEEAETYDRSLAQNTGAVVNTSGTLLLIGGVTLRPDIPVSTITLTSGNVAASAPTNQWFCLVDQRSLKVLAVTSDDLTVAWGTNFVKPLSFAAPYVAPDFMPVYIGFLFAGTTPPTLRGNPISASVPPGTLVPRLLGHSTAGLTGPLAVGTAVTTPGGATDHLPYAYVS